MEMNVKRVVNAWKRVENAKLVINKETGVKHMEISLKLLSHIINNALRTFYENNVILIMRLKMGNK